jgi:hypothetical protein
VQRLSSIDVALERATNRATMQMGKWKSILGDSGDRLMALCGEVYMLSEVVQAAREGWLLRENIKRLWQS